MTARSAPSDVGRTRWLGSSRGCGRQRRRRSARTRTRSWAARTDFNCLANASAFRVDPGRSARDRGSCQRVALLGPPSVARLGDADVIARAFWQRPAILARLRMIEGSCTSAPIAIVNGSRIASSRSGSTRSLIREASANSTTASVASASVGTVSLVGYTVTSSSTNGPTSSPSSTGAIAGVNGVSGQPARHPGDGQQGRGECRDLPLHDSPPAAPPSGGGRPVSPTASCASIARLTLP